MKFKCVQTFSLEYLQRCQEMNPIEILQFLDDFHQLHTASLKSFSKELQKGVSTIEKLQFNTSQKPVLK